MDVNEFNSTVVRNEDPEAIELDMQPFGARQAEAVEFWLDAAELQQRGVSVSVVGQR